MTKRSVKNYYKKTTNLKGGLQKRDYFFEELKKLKEKIKEKQEEEIIKEND